MRARHHFIRVAGAGLAAAALATAWTAPGSTASAAETAAVHNLASPAAGAVPAGCTMQALQPKIRQRHIVGRAVFECTHPQTIQFFGSGLQRKKAGHWRMVSGTGDAMVHLRANQPFFMITNPVRCLSGRHTYRSQAHAEFSSGGVTKNSPAVVLNC